MSQTPIYQDSQRPVEERVEDLLQRMTLEEKVGQMLQMDGRQSPEYWVQEKQVGALLHVTGEVTQTMQRLAARNRLSIPLLFGIDAVHGHAIHPTGTVFPTQLGLSCSWNPQLLEEIGKVTAKEVAATGIHWTFAPVLDIARDLRWGRIDETFGEDPLLVGVLGSALLRGYQGKNLADPYSILACAKHYAGYSGTQGGRDASEAELTRRSLRSLYLKPFEAAAQAGCATFMAGYQAIDGAPCSANRWLLQEVLKDEWGFEGFLVTDWNNMGRMHVEQKVCATMEEAAQRTLEAGNDMIMSTPEFFDTALNLVKSGKIAEARLDDACRRILRLKFQSGLFDHKRYVNLQEQQPAIGCEEYRQLALKSACQSIVLLKNQNNLLPLSEEIRKIAVIGPNADDIVAQLGDWVFLELMETFIIGREMTDMPTREDVVTVLQGIRQRAPQGCQVAYCKGCDVLDSNTEGIAEAVEVAKNAEVAIVVIGDTLAQNGEVRDRANLDLSGAQQLLLEAIHATGTPLVVVLLNGKPLSIPWIKEHAQAIVEAWNPGVEGGTAVAGILFGDRNPVGRLTISFPYHVGQQPVYYNQIPGWHAERYVDMPAEPLFAFGYGLSYTTFEYANLQLSTTTLQPGETLKVNVDVRNTGQRAGTEIVQLYINDLYSSVTTPIKELKAFQRVELQAGETRTVELEVPYQQLALVNEYLETIVEPGEFEVMVGSSSRNQDLLKARFEV